MSSPGNYRHVFTITDPKPTLNDYGELEAPSDNDEWTKVATVLGSLKAIAGEEYEQGDKVSSRVTYEIEIHYIPGVTDKMRFELAFEGSTRYFNIDKILPDVSQLRTLKCICKEKTT